MSDGPVRIRVQHSPRDPEALRFLLDAPVQAGRGSARFDGPTEGAPLAGALFAVAGVSQVAVDGASIHVRKRADARWQDMKAPIAAAIRAILANAEQPLGEASDETAGDGDARMLATVRDLLDSRINPSIARHGGHITAERVAGAILYLRMSGGCQGCAASQLTLRGGVERVLRAALPDLRGIVDLTDHDAGTRPFYGGGPGGVPQAASPLVRLASGRRPAAETSGPEPEGEARPVAGPARAELAERVRRHLEALPPSAPRVNYGALARALGLARPGSISDVTRALEDTMHEDARAGRPFIAARAVSRAGNGSPGKGFFELARSLARGPREGETERAFHAREIARLERAALDHTRPGGRSDRTSIVRAQ